MNGAVYYLFLCNTTAHAYPQLIGIHSLQGCGLKSNPGGGHNKTIQVRVICKHAKVSVRHSTTTQETQTVHQPLHADDLSGTEPSVMQTFAGDSLFMVYGLCIHL